MAAKKSLADLLGDETTKPVIRRGQGLQLSTNTAEPEADEDAQAHKRTSAQATNTQPRRVSQGYRLREDLVKACKHIALEEDHTLYEVMEEALEQYLERRKN